MRPDESAPKSEEILRLRWREVERCLRAEAYLAATIMMGSLLEGVLFFLFRENPKAARQCSCAPKKGDKVKDFAEWKLGEMIDAAREMEWIGYGIKKLSHSVRDFRNLVHPAEQLKNNESPGHPVAKISWQIVQTAIRDEIGKVDSIAKGREFQTIAKLADEFANASAVGGGTVASPQSQGSTKGKLPEGWDETDKEVFKKIVEWFYKHGRSLRENQGDYFDYALLSSVKNPARAKASVEKLIGMGLIVRVQDEDRSGMSLSEVYGGLIPTPEGEEYAKKNLWLLD